jgi:LPXTG-motif cell wall-anchored protein
MPLVLNLMILLVQEAPTAAPPASSDVNHYVQQLRSGIAPYLKLPTKCIQQRVIREDGSAPREWNVHLDGPYRRKWERQGRNALREDVMNPEQSFGFFRHADEPAWTVVYQHHLYPELRRETENRWERTTDLWGLREVDLWPTPTLFATPEWTFTAVTNEPGAMLRFHFKHEWTRLGHVMHKTGYLEVDPQRSWAIVRARLADRRLPGNETEVDFQYEGTVAGLPALKRVEIRLGQRDAQGKIDYKPLRTIEVLKFIDNPPFEKLDFSISSYRRDAPTGWPWWPTAVGLGVVGLAGVVLARRRKRPVKQLTWDVEPA